MDNKKIELNNMTDICSNITCIIEEMDLIKLSKTKLLEKCEELGITKCKSKNKSKLIELINAKSKKTEIEFIIQDDDNKDLQEKNNVIENTINEITDNKEDVKYSFIEVCAGGGGLSSGLIKMKILVQLI